MRSLYRIFINLFFPDVILKQINVGKYFSFVNQKCRDVDKRIMVGEPIAVHLQDLTWASIIFGPYRYCGKPFKNERKSISILKWIYIKFFYVNLTKTASSFSSIDFIFSRNVSKLIIFGYGKHVAEIFSFHNPNADIKRYISLPSRYNNIICLFFANLCSYFNKKDKSDGVVYVINVVDPNFLLAFNKIHPNKTIILRLHDIYSEIFHTSDVACVRSKLSYLLTKKIVNSVESYSKEDAEKLKIKHVWNRVRKDIPNFSSDEKFLWMFVGHASDSGNRLSGFYSIKEFITKNFPEKKFYELIASSGDKLISYEEYIEILGKSRIVVDLYRIQPNEGWSFRISEALVMRKKVITNRSNVKESAVYHPSRFFIIGNDDLSRLPEFIESSYLPVPEEILKHFYYSTTE